MLPKLGIIAGGGSLPCKIIEQCLLEQREYFILALAGHADPEYLKSHPHQFIQLGNIGTALELLRTYKVKEVLMAGHVKRPSFSSLKLDYMGVKLLARITKNKLLGDDHVLKVIAKFLEEHGFKVIGPDDVLKKLLSPGGILGTISPLPQDLLDIELGIKYLAQIGQFDIGQAVIVQNLRILGVEAAEGTDELIKRCGQLHGKTPGGVLVKLKKPEQDVRIDLPTIGTRTIQLAHKAVLSGIAISAHGTIILEFEQVLAEANKLGLFVSGITTSLGTTSI
jgi:DUF1009 family protein